MRGGADVTDAARPNPNVAQKLPILSKVSWGGNRLTGATTRFVVSTEVGAMVGPIDLLHGNTILSDYLTQITVGTPSDVYWRYVLSYETSKSTGRLLLDKVERADVGSYPALRQWRFTYEPGGPVFDPSWGGRPALTAGWFGITGDRGRAGIARGLEPRRWEAPRPGASRLGDPNDARDELR